MKTLAFRVVDRTSISVSSAANPSDAEWTAWLDAAVNAKILRSLVITHGGAPNSGQRRQMELRAKATGVRTRVAIVSDSRIVRGILTALSWLNFQDHRAFAPDDLSAAIDHLGLTKEGASIRAILAELEHEIVPQSSTSKEAHALIGATDPR